MPLARIMIEVVAETDDPKESAEKMKVAVVSEITANLEEISAWDWRRTHDIAIHVNEVNFVSMKVL